MSAVASPSGAPLGCYGLRIDGLPGAARYLGSPEPGAPVLRVRRRVLDADSATDDDPDLFGLDADRASLPLSDGRSRCELDRASGTADLTLATDYADEALLHPLLSGSCAVRNWWHGRDAFHAGAFVIDGRAWAVVGDKGQGKSSTLAFLSTRGIPILSDDLVVEDRGDVLAGPAFVDLRPDAARQLGEGRDLGRLGARPRFRLDVAPAPRRVPLAGWIVLAWGPDLALTPVPLAARVKLLLDNRAVLLQPAAPQAFVAHAARPFLQLRRPQRWDVLPDVEQLLRTCLPTPSSG